MAIQKARLARRVRNSARQRGSDANINVCPIGRWTSDRRVAYRSGCDSFEFSICLPVVADAAIRQSSTNTPFGSPCPESMPLSFHFCSEGKARPDYWRNSMGSAVSMIS